MSSVDGLWVDRLNNWRENSPQLNPFGVSRRNRRPPGRSENVASDDPKRVHGGLRL